MEMQGLAAIRARLAEAERKAGRAPGSVRLIAVSKVQPEDRVRAVLEAGQRVFGENRVQEAEGRWAARRGFAAMLVVHEDRKIARASRPCPAPRVAYRAALTRRDACRLAHARRAPRRPDGALPAHIRRAHAGPLRASARAVRRSWLTG